MLRLPNKCPPHCYHTQYQQYIIYALNNLITHISITSNPLETQILQSDGVAPLRTFALLMAALFLLYL